MKRILAFTLIFAMLFTAMLGIMPSAAQTLGSTQTPTLSITRANVEFASTVYLLIEVNYALAGFDENPGVKVKVTNNAGDVTILESDDTIEDIASGCVGFKYTDLSAKEMGDILDIEAYVDGDDTVATDEITFSILEYAIRAKATYPDNQELVTVCDKMLAFGAAAQEAFAYEKSDYELADKDGDVIDYGIVLVGGAATGKNIAEVGTTITPAADSSIFTNAATLYNMDFTAAGTSLTVKNGISRYFYYGNDITGDVNKFADSATVLNQVKTTNYHLFSNLDFSKTVTMDAPVNVHSKGFFLRQDYNTGAIKSAILTTNSSATFASQYWALWGIYGYEGNTTTGASPSAQLGTGYLYLKTSSAENNVSLYNAKTANTVAFVDAENKVTVSVAVAVTTANCTNTTMVGSFVDSRSASKSGAVSGATNVPQADLFHVENGVMYVGEEDNTSGAIATLNQVDGSWSSNALLVVHFVLDLNRETVTAYNGNTGEVMMRSIDIPDSFFYYDNAVVTDCGFNLKISGEAYVSRITISEGDIFN